MRKRKCELKVSYFLPFLGEDVSPASNCNESQICEVGAVEEGSLFKFWSPERIGDSHPKAHLKISLKAGFLSGRRK